MAWIEVHQELRKHPKVIRLAVACKVRTAEAMGMIVNLWLWAAQYAKDGNLTGFSDTEISDACDTPMNVRQALEECGWIDEKKGKKVIHDWKKHGLRLLESNNERVRKHREIKKMEAEGEHYGNVTVMATIPNLTIPNLTIPEICTHILGIWNSSNAKTEMPAVIKLSNKRISAIRQRVREKEFDLGKILEEIERSEFLRGHNQKGWKCDFDFVFCSANNYLKILEGKYRNGTTQVRSKGNSQTDRATFKHSEEMRKNDADLLETFKQRDRERGERSGPDTVAGG